MKKQAESETAYRRNPRAFMIGFQLGGLAIEDAAEGGGIFSTTHCFGSSLRQGFNLGCDAASARRDLKVHIKQLQEAANV